MLINSYSNLIECGTDEAGRGCLAGPVTAAAVILPKDFKNKELTDSKKLSKKKREFLRKIIIEEAIDYSVIHVDVKTIDKINILNASILAMNKAIASLKKKPEFILLMAINFIQRIKFRTNVLLKVI